MLTFNIGEPKLLSMMVNATGIDPGKLTFLFSIIVNEVSYGFKCMVMADKTTVTIPSLETIIKDIKPGEYPARLDVFGDKYYMCPFNEPIAIVAPVKLAVTFADNKEVPAIAIKTTVIDEPPLSTPAYVQPNREPVEESKPVKKQSKFAREFTNFKKVEKNEV